MIGTTPYFVKQSLQNRFNQLKNNLKNMESVAIAFSGGVDSTFLVKVAFDILKEKAIAITATSSTYPKRELEYAKNFSKNLGIKHIIIKSEETEISNFSKNPINRCYFCKKELFLKIKKIAKDNHLNFILDGSNADDSFDYRPGEKALKELGIISPLKDAGLTKQDIRDLSKKIDLDSWNKSAFACLASRFPYGEKITKSKLKKVEQAETFLFSLGIKQLRVRYHGDIAKIEVMPNDFQKIINHSDEIINYFKKLKFTYVTLDLQGYRTGSLNEGLIK